MTSIDLPLPVVAEGVGPGDAVQITVGGPINEIWFVVLNNGIWGFMNEPGGRVIARLARRGPDLAIADEQPRRAGGDL